MAETAFNLFDVFATWERVGPDRECVIWRDRRLTYADIGERSRRFASYLASCGLGIRHERAGLAGHECGQDLVAQALYNGNEYLETMLGAYGARVAPFNVNYRYTGEELRYLLNDAQPRAVVFHASLAPTLSDVLDDCPSIDVLIQVADESGEALLPGAIDYEEALAVSDPAGPAVERSGDDCYVLYTGGTTGMPKGVLWRQHDIFMSAMGGRRIGSWDCVHTYEDVAVKSQNGFGLRLLVLPPLMHGAAQWASFMLLADGSTLVFPDDPRRMLAPDVWNTIAREKVNLVTIVGDAVARPLIDELNANPERYDTSSLMAFGNGGAPLTPAVRELILTRLPNLMLTDTAGSSETGAQMTHASTGTESGRFVPGPGAVVIDETMTAFVQPGHDGIGWLAQGGFVPLGYLGDAEKTARTFPVIEGERYAVPGDRARLLDDGQIELLGRDSVTINSGGEKIFAEEVERALAVHPDLTDVVVAGRPSSRWGQEVVAIVSLRDGSNATAQDLIDCAAKSIARYKLPKAVVVVDHVVRSPSGKADYRWAAEQAGHGD